MRQSRALFSVLPREQKKLLRLHYIRCWETIAVREQGHLQITYITKLPSPNFHWNCFINVHFMTEKDGLFFLCSSSPDQFRPSVSLSLEELDKRKSFLPSAKFKNNFEIRIALCILKIENTYVWYSINKPDLNIKYSLRSFVKVIVRKLIFCFCKIFSLNSRDNFNEMALPLKLKKFYE